MLVVLMMSLLVSGTTLWAQEVQTDRNVSTLAVRQKVDEAAARARADEVKQSELRQRTSSDITLQLKKSLDLQKALGTSGPQYYTYQSGSPIRSNDPLSTLQVAPGTWWNNTNAASMLNLTKDQQKKMDDIFQQFRLKLIDLNAALSKEELILDPLIASERLDEPKILTQIDRIAQARAELEKANSRMLLAIRQSLTMEQWSKIQDSPGTFRNPVIRK
jgi:Spy/CpxP family protein refolding chaperone